ncbi:MAG: ROK family protein, partial [Bacteroidales bacterium]
MICGIDIGGTNSVVGLVSKQGELLDHESIKTAKFYSPNDLVLAIAESIVRMTKVSGQKLEGIGIGCPNGNPFHGTMVSPVNIAFQGSVPLVQLFKLYFPDILIKLDNDANAATIGERIYGAAKDLQDFIYITLGTGLGSGFVVHGQLVYGHNGMAGEVGHLIIEPNGRSCGCGRKGCLERYTSASGIMITYKELCKKHFQKPTTDNYKDLCVLAQKDDLIAIETFEKTGAILGLALANLATVTAPSHIFLFGGVAQAGNILLEPTRKYFDENLLFSYKDTVKIELSALMSKNAGILGGAALVQS